MSHDLLFMAVAGTSEGLAIILDTSSREAWSSMRDKPQD